MSFILGMIAWNCIIVWEDTRSTKKMKEQDILRVDFIQYLWAHPGLRFWQALSSWSGYHILAYPIDKSPIDTLIVPDLHDTYYWRGIGDNKYEVKEKK
jgi:hypothetical protein